MIGFLRSLRRRKERKRETSDLIHAMRNQAQVAELERYRIQQNREKRERQDLADALARTRPPFRLGEEHRR